MRLEPLEMYILDCFRERQATRLLLSDIVGNTTANRYAALQGALNELESQHLVRRRGEHNEVFELTSLGREYAGIVFPC